MNMSLYQQVYEQIRDRIDSGDLTAGSKLPNQETLSAEFGVSAITIRRALEMLRADGYVSRRPRVGTIVAERVRAEPFTRGRVDGRPLVGCIFTNFDDTFGTHTLSAIVESSRGRADVVVKRSLGDIELEEELLHDLIESGVDGIIMLPSSSHFVPASVMGLTARQFPLVVLDRAFESVPVSTVSSDNVGGAITATEHLFSLGHERIGLIMPTHTVSTIDERRTGVIYAHAQNRFPFNPSHEYRDVRSVVPGDLTPVEDDIARLTAFLTANPTLTAFVVSEYNIARMLWRAAQRVGREVPRDVSIICFDHPPMAFRIDSFRFTHVRQDESGLGTIALDQVLRQIVEPTTVAKHQLATRLVVADSTAPPHR